MQFKIRIRCNLNFFKIPNFAIGKTSKSIPALFNSLKIIINNWTINCMQKCMQGSEAWKACFAQSIKLNFVGNRPVTWACCPRKHQRRLFPYFARFVDGLNLPNCCSLHCFRRKLLLNRSLIAQLSALYTFAAAAFWKIDTSYSTFYLFI